MVARLVAAGHLRDPRITRAFRAVPRDRFLPEYNLAEAYSDVALAILTRDDATMSTISQPAMIALMLEQLGVQSGDRVLEIGTGSGYNAALLAELAAPSQIVVTVDIEPELVSRARGRLDETGYPMVTVVCGDGFEGYPPLAPYDRIVLTVASADIARAWFEELAPNGRIVLPLVVHALQQSVAFDRIGDELVSTSLVGAEFIPLRGSGAPGMETVRIDDGIRVRMRYASSAGIDERLAAALLQGRSRRRPVPIPLVTGDEFDVAFWLDLVRKDVCTLRASGESERIASFPTLTRDERETMYTFGIVANDGLAFVEREGTTTILRIFGDAQEPARALADGIASWDRAGRPRAEDACLVARFDGTAREEAALVLRRKHATISVLFKKSE